MDWWMAAAVVLNSVAGGVWLAGAIAFQKPWRLILAAANIVLAFLLFGMIAE